MCGIVFCVLIRFRGAVGAMDSVSDFESGGCGFESRIAYSFYCVLNFILATFFNYYDITLFLTFWSLFHLYSYTQASEISILKRYLGCIEIFILTNKTQNIGTHTKLNRIITDMRLHRPIHCEYSLWHEYQHRLLFV